MNRKFWMAAAVVTAMLGGCAQEKDPVTDDFSELAGADEKSDIFSTNWRLMGSMSYGQTSASVAYSNPPRYRAFKFAGAAGDKVDVWVRSTNGGDSVAWVLNDAFVIQGSNDDASASNYDSHIVTTLGANREGIVTYYVVFRDYDLARANFKVTLRKTGTAGCNYDGQHYNSGDNFPSSDGCNTCSCGPTGSVACTKRACIATCDYAGVTHNVGDTFPSDDGCNTCSCTSGGNVACTERACAPNWNKKYMYTPSQCQLVRFVCAPGSNYFSDTRGCGCEQPSDCPEWINCQPPTDCSAERARCPLSQIAW